jgi:hypothetical protein
MQNSNSLVRYPRRTSAVTLLSLLALTSFAHSQPNRLQPGGIGALRVPITLPRLSPELRTYLIAQKPAVDAAIFDRSFVMQDGIPAFKLDDGSIRLLMTGNEPGPQGNGADAIPDDLAEARPYITAPLRLGDKRAFPFKFSDRLTLPTGVDHTESMTPIRDQGYRGTCVAFATNAALEAFASIPDDLSEQFTYHQCLEHDKRPYNYNSGTYTETVMDIMKEGTVAESDWKYTSTIPPANETVPTSASQGKRYKITDAQFISDNGLTGVSIKNPNYLETILNQGKNIVITTEVAWYGSHNNDVIDVVLVNGQPAGSRGRHEMVIVGYNSAKQYFIVRNSWGTSFGHAGYAHLSYDYIRTYLVNGFYIKAVEPKMVIFNPNIRDKIGTSVRPLPGLRVIK